MEVVKVKDKQDERKGTRWKKIEAKHSFFGILFDKSDLELLEEDQQEKAINEKMSYLQIPQSSQW